MSAVGWWIIAADLALAILFQLRNWRTLKFRRAVLAILHERAKEDIERGEHPVWIDRYHTFEQVSYARVLWSFKRLEPESFWSDVSFLMPREALG